MGSPLAPPQTQRSIYRQLLPVGSVLLRDRLSSCGCCLSRSHYQEAGTLGKKFSAPAYPPGARELNCLRAQIAVRRVYFVPFGLVSLQQRGRTKMARHSDQKAPTGYGCATGGLRGQNPFAAAWGLDILRRLLQPTAALTRMEPCHIPVAENSAPAEYASEYHHRRRLPALRLQRVEETPKQAS